MVPEDEIVLHLNQWRVLCKLRLVLFLKSVHDVQDFDFNNALAGISDLIFDHFYSHHIPSAGIHTLTDLSKRPSTQERQDLVSLLFRGDDLSVF
jgi:hypothetical protein